jgi:hypothetical protein
MAHPRDVRIAELKAQIESAKAEIKQLEADVQAEVAEDSQLDGTLMNRNTDDAIAAYEADKKNERELTGQRNEDGDFIEAQTYREMTADEQKLYDAIMADDWDGTLTDELQLIANDMSVDDFIDTGIPIVQKKTFPIDDTDDGKGKGMNFKAAAEDTEPKMAEKKKGSGMDLTGQNKKDDEKDDSPLEVEVKLDPDNWLDQDEKTDEESGKMKFKGVQPVETFTSSREGVGEIELDGGRTYAEEDTSVERTMGFQADDGGNMSVNEKDDFWKTQEGYDKAVEMYGKKPAWVKEPTLIWNPETQEYEEVEPEDFVDLSPPKKRPKL